MKKNKVTLLLILVLSFQIIGQNLSAQRTGNIVEIFGRERTEKTGEGIILHEFTEGLSLKNSMRPGLLTGGQDILFWQIATNKFEQPKSGNKLAVNYKKNPTGLIWERVVVDSTGTFREMFSRGYIYTEFTSPKEINVLLEAKGHTQVYINGFPYEGDHYDYGHTLIPFKLKKGLNQFIYTYGRFSTLNSKIVIPQKELQFTSRDLTLPSVIRGEKDAKWGAIRIVNASEKTINDLSITCILSTGEKITYNTNSVMPMAVRKVKFKIPAPLNTEIPDSISALLILKNSSGKEIDRINIPLKVRNAEQTHERTFISGIDGSVQYFSIAPSTNTSPKQALVLTVHGASVEATNQARAYRQKNWGHIVAPTNRRPFGFNWEDWGRMDALEVLHEARMLYSTDTSQTYLTGHSMGGHGSWFLGATYPDKWAVVAPAAGYPDIIGYRRTGNDTLSQPNIHFEMIYRGALPGRTIDLVRNYLQSGVYILHGEADRVVSVEQARLMRSKLGQFHNNFTYYEYPGGSHWYGDHSVDWAPLFDFMRQNTIAKTSEVTKFEFRTASPGVSASNYWVRINQQINAYKHSDIKAEFRNDTILLQSGNIRHMTILLSLLKPGKKPTIIIDNQALQPNSINDISIINKQGTWTISHDVAVNEKNPDRYGGFKLAFTNNVVLVYGTTGTGEENLWNLNKARMDAETFLYRGNGSFEVISDKEFLQNKYKDRSVILYGNANTNKAWQYLLKNAPVQVTREGIKLGSKYFKGENLGTYFIYPRPDSKKATVGVVAGTGISGIKSVSPNNYFSGITGFPDLLIFDIDWLKEGLDGVKVSGFFGNDWSIENGEFRISE